MTDLRSSGRANIGDPIGQAAQFADLASGRMCWEQRGSGPDLLVVMGLAGQMTDWPSGLIDQLAAHFTVTLFDNRDSGLSFQTTAAPPPRWAFVKAAVTRKPLDFAYTITDMAADAAGLLDHLGIEKTHVMGMSMGGMISQSLAISGPHRVLSLTSIMSHPGDMRTGRANLKVLATLARMDVPSRDQAAQYTVDQFTLFAGSSWDKETHRVRSQASVDRAFNPSGTDRQLAAIAASPDRTPALKHLTAPTLVIHGLQDTLVQPSGGMATARAVPGSRLLMFPDMGHDLPATRWDEITDAVVDLADVAAPASA